MNVKYIFLLLRMRRDNKYATNRTVRFCQEPFQSRQFSYNQLCIDKRNLWQLISLLKPYVQSTNRTNKIVLRRNFNFYQYNGYISSQREHPPKHVSFARRPDFIYQPYANFILLNRDMFNRALSYGWKFLQNGKNLQQMLDVNEQNISLTLIYFLDAPSHFCSSDWYLALKHAIGGHFAAYHLVCWGDYCPLGPKIRGKQMSDSRINQILFVAENNSQSKLYSNCSCKSWERLTRSDRHQYKKERSQIKMQRRETQRLTKQARNYSTIDNLSRTNFLTVVSKCL